MLPLRKEQALEHALHPCRGLPDAPDGDGVDGAAGHNPLVRGPEGASSESAEEFQRSASGK